MIDTHCHLDLEDFSKDLPEVIAHAKEAGVFQFLVPSIDVVSCHNILKLVNQYPNQIFLAAGIHPNYASQANFRDLAEFIEKYIRQISAIGEIGLDFYRTYSEQNEQISLLKNCLDLAQEYDLPIVLHNRDAEETLLSVLDEWYPIVEMGAIKPNGVFHAYSGSSLVANWGLTHGFLFGIGGMITYKKNQPLRNTVLEIGLENLVLETDSPYLAPVPHRGKRNSPENLLYIVDSLATIFNVSNDELIKITDKNASGLFGEIKNAN